MTNHQSRPFFTESLLKLGKLTRNQILRLRSEPIICNTSFQLIQTEKVYSTAQWWTGSIIFLFTSLLRLPNRPEAIFSFQIYGLEVWMQNEWFFLCRDLVSSSLRSKYICLLINETVLFVAMPQDSPIHACLDQKHACCTLESMLGIPLLSLGIYRETIICIFSQEEPWPAFLRLLQI